MQSVKRAWIAINWPGPERRSSGNYLWWAIDRNNSTAEQWKRCHWPWYSKRHSPCNEMRCLETVRVQRDADQIYANRMDWKLVHMPTINDSTGGKEPTSTKCSPHFSFKWTFTRPIVVGRAHVRAPHIIKNNLNLGSWNKTPKSKTWKRVFLEWLVLPGWVGWVGWWWWGAIKSDVDGELELNY